MNFDVHKLPQTGSTNDEALRAAEQGSAQGYVVWALRQNAGRGRHGREWQSPEGNLYFSLVLRPQSGAESYGHYSFVAALAISDAILGFLPQAKIELKWPNDVLVNGKKISGVLLEAGKDALVLGIGINVAHFPKDAQYPATSLVAEKVCNPELEILLYKILEGVSCWVQTLEGQGFTAVREAWLNRAKKGEMRVRLPQGEVRGQFSGLDADGSLKLLTPEGEMRKIGAGDVFFG